MSRARMHQRRYPCYNEVMLEELGKEIITTKEAARIAGRSRDQILHLLRHGIIKGRKMGRDWLTTREEVKRYIATKPRPGRKPKKRA